MANESIKFSLAALANIQETSADIAGDIATLRSGEHTPESLMAHCLNGAGKDRLQGWYDYVVALAAAVSEIPLFIPTHEITTDGQRFLVVNDDGAFFTEEERGDDGEHAWGLDDCNDLVFEGGTPPSGSAYRELSPLEPHFVVDGEPHDGAFTVGQFLLANLDAAPPVHEILMMMLLKVGHRISFGGGGAATTTIRRVR